MNNCFPKKLRLITREDFVVNKKSSLCKSKYFLIFYNSNNKENPRLGLKISKKAGNAIRRNYIKRISREIFRRLCFKNNIDLTIVINSRNYNTKLSKSDLFHDLEKGLINLSKS